MITADILRIVLISLIPFYLFYSPIYNIKEKSGYERFYHK